MKISSCILRLLFASLIVLLSVGCSKKSDSTDNGTPQSDATATSTPLHDAVRTGDIEKVRDLLKADANAVHSKDGAGMTPLHVAAAVGNAEITQLLLEHKADINAVDAKRYTPFNLAFNAGHKDVVAILWKAGGGQSGTAAPAPPASSPTSSAPPQTGGGTIFEAARNGDLERVRTLLKADPNLISSKDDKGRAPIFHAVIGKQKAVLEFLIAQGADATTTAANGMTPLHIAAFHGFTEGGKILLDKRANPNARGGQYATTPLHAAANGGHPEFIALLISRGADPNARDNQGNTPLIYIVGGDTERADVVEALLKGKANPNASTGQNVTLVQIAQQKGYQRTIQLLRQYGGR
jgi:ankyrin repeat protein